MLLCGCGTAPGSTLTTTRNGNAAHCCEIQPSSIQSPTHLILRDVVIDPDFVWCISQRMAKNSFEFLELINCRATEFVASTLLRRLPYTLKKLHFIECNFSLTSSPVSSIVETDSNVLHLSSLRMINSQLSEHVIVDVICNQNIVASLTTLDLRGTALSEKVHLSLAALLARQDCRLEKLILDEAYLSNVSLDVLYRYGLKYNHSLRKINLRNNPLLIQCTTTSMKLLTLTTGCGNLQHLDISDNPQLLNGNQDYFGSDYIFKHLRSNAKVCNLQLENCGLSAKSMAFLSSAMCSWPLLKELNLSRNNLAGTRDWSCALGAQSLKLRSCQLHDSDCSRSPKVGAFDHEHAVRRLG